MKVPALRQSRSTGGLWAERFAADWQTRYGYRSVLLETFVQCDRFVGTSCRAANWIHVGQTQGRG